MPSIILSSKQDYSVSLLAAGEGADRGSTSSFKAAKSIRNKSLIGSKYLNRVLSDFRSGHTSYKSRSFLTPASSYLRM